MARPALPTRRRCGREGYRTTCSPLPGVGLRFLSISAIDGFRIAAALWHPVAKPAATTTLLVQVHGSGGNFASLQLRATARALSARGFAALSISTRQHDEQVNTDNFFEVRRDIEAAVATAKADRKSTRLNSSHMSISYAVFCLKKQNRTHRRSSAS